MEAKQKHQRLVDEIDIRDAVKRMLRHPCATDVRLRLKEVLAETLGKIARLESELRDETN